MNIAVLFSADGDLEKIVSCTNACTSAFVGAAVTTDSQGIRAAGVVTATSFVGDGSGLSGVESWNQQDTWLYGGG